MWTLLLITAIGVAPPATEVHTLGGQVLTGSIKELDGQRLTIETAEGPVSIDFEQLVGLSPQEVGTKEGARPTVRVELADGSSVFASDYRARGGKAHIALADGLSLELPTQNVVALRLQPDSDAVADQWAKIRHSDAKTDLLIVRKDTVLDFHRGIVREVDDSTVQFELEGEVLGVKRAKVFGIVYYRPGGREMPEATGRLTDTAGSTWLVRNLSLDENGLKWTTPLGLDVHRNWAEVARIDFSQGKIVYLSDLEPDSLRWVPYLGALQPFTRRSDLYAPRRDTNLSGGPLELNGKVYAKGLALHSRTELIYRLPGEFRRFKTTAGIDDAVRPRGNVHLVIRGDDRVLFESVIAGTDPPKELDVDTAGVRRLSILVDFGDDLDVADHLDLCDARMVK